MENKEIIEKLKNQIPSFKKITGLDEEKLKDLVDKTKVYIFGLWLDRKDENFRKGVINMIEEYRTYRRSRGYNEVLEIKSRLKNILEAFIEILEIREKAKAEENDTPEE